MKKTVFTIFFLTIFNSLFMFDSNKSAKHFEDDEEARSLKAMYKIKHWLNGDYAGDASSDGLEKDEEPLGVERRKNSFLRFLGDDLFKGKVKESKKSLSLQCNTKTYPPGRCPNKIVWCFNDLRQREAKVLLKELEAANALTDSLVELEGQEEGSGYSWSWSHKKFIFESKEPEEKALKKTKGIKKKTKSIKQKKR